MNFEEAFKELLKGRKIRREDWKPDIYVLLGEDRVLKDNNNKLTSIIFNCDSMINDNWEIYKDPILDKQEKKYLENFLRPFAKRFDKILIMKNSNKDFSWLEIYFYPFKEDKDYSNFINFPKFKKDKHMYDGMESNKRYTLDELGLFKEERK